MLEKFDKDSIEVVIDNLSKLLAGLGGTYGMQVKMSDLRYSEVSATLNLQFILDNPKARQNSFLADKLSFEKGAKELNIDKNLFRTALPNMPNYVLHHIDLDDHKYPIAVMEKETKNIYKISLKDLKDLLKEDKDE